MFAPDTTSRRGSEEGKTGQRTGQVQQPLEQVGSPLVADTETAIAKQPGKRALHHPSVSSESLAGVYAAARNPWRDPTSPEGTAQGRESKALSTWSLAGRFRGRPDLPRGPMIEGIASTSGNSCVESWVLAAERWIASGMPFRSTMR